MLRGSAILFTGLFSIILFRRNLLRLQWLAIVIVMAGLVLVGTSSMLRQEYDPPAASVSDGVTTAPPDAKHVLLGTFLVLLGSALNSAQTVTEEKILKGPVR